VGGGGNFSIIPRKKTKKHRFQIYFACNEKRNRNTEQDMSSMRKPLNAIVIKLKNIFTFCPVRELWSRSSLVVEISRLEFTIPKTCKKCHNFS
jgi:hypothetical protein